MGNPATWLTLVEDTAVGEGRRADAVRNVCAIAEAIVLRLATESMSSRPLWARIQRETGLAESVVAKWIAWLHHHKLLVTFEHGSIWAWRPAELADSELENRAAVYLLTTPTEVPTSLAPPPPSPAADVTPDALVDKTQSPQVSLPKQVDNPVHAREKTSPLRGPGHRRKQPRQPGSPVSGRFNRLLVGAEVQQRCLPLRRLTPQHVASVLRDFLAAGWTTNDIFWALDHTPDGTQRPYSSDVRFPAGWAINRLRDWRDPNGAPLPSRSANLTAAALRLHAARMRSAEQARQRVEAAAAANPESVLAAIVSARQQASEAARRARWL